MTESFLTYQKFTSQDVANDVMSLLDEHSIEYKIEKFRREFNLYKGDSPLDEELVLKIQPENFEKVNMLLIDSVRDQVNYVKDDYYLFSFSDEELVDVVARADEWSAFDVLVAQKLLDERGIKLNTHTLKMINAHKLDELYQPEKRRPAIVTVGYIFAVLGGILAIFIGWYISTIQKTMPNGQRMFVYTSADRKHGRRLMFLGTASFFIWWTIKYYSV